MEFLDLKTQQKRIRKPLEKRINKILDHGAYIMGPEVFELEEKLADSCGVKHAISCSSGTDALLIPLMAWGIGPGDAVFTTPFTYVATAEVISILGATPVFVDVYESTFNIDCEKLETEINKVINDGKLKPKAIIPVDLFGLPARYRLIDKIAKKYDLKVIEDAAQSFGGSIRDKKVGTFGDIAATSFYPAKPLGCYGDGGAIFTNDDDLAHTIRGIVNHGMYKRYHHDVVGVNSRLDSIQAAVLDAKLPHLDNYNKARQNAARKYNAAFKNHPNIETPKAGNGCETICDNCDCHVFHQYTIKLKNADRDGLVAHLNANGIPCGVYYPIPLHKQKAYQDERYNDEDFQVTNLLSKEVISLPMHTELDDEQIEFITTSVLSFLT